MRTYTSGHLKGKSYKAKSAILHAPSNKCYYTSCFTLVRCELRLHRDLLISSFLQRVSTCAFFFASVRTMIAIEPVHFFVGGMAQHVPFQMRLSFTTVRTMVALKPVDFVVSSMS